MHTEDRTGSQALAPDGQGARWGRVFAAGTAVVAGLATVLSQARPAYADCQHSPCCDLARCNGCAPNHKPFGWNCPSGYFRTSWTCVWGGTHHVICGECSRGRDCFTGPWACSIWFEIN